MLCHEYDANAPALKGENKRGGGMENYLKLLTIDSVARASSNASAAAAEARTLLCMASCI